MEFRATVNMRDEIIKCLDLSNAQTTVGSFDRPNIFIKVKKKTTMFDDLINSDAILPYKSIFKVISKRKNVLRHYNLLPDKAIIGGCSKQTS